MTFELAGLVVIVLLTIFCVWLDIRVQRLENALWHHLMQHVKDETTEDA